MCKEQNVSECERNCYEVRANQLFERDVIHVYHESERLVFVDQC